MRLSSPRLLILVLLGVQDHIERLIVSPSGSTLPAFLTNIMLVSDLVPPSPAQRGYLGPVVYPSVILSSPFLMRSSSFSAILGCTNGSPVLEGRISFFPVLCLRSHAAYDVQPGHPSMHPGPNMPFLLTVFFLLSPLDSIELGLPRLVPPPRLSMPSLVGRDLPSIKNKVS